MEEKKYINIDNMATRLCQILEDARESMVDDKNKDFIMENFSDKHLEDKSNEMAWQFNSDMKQWDSDEWTDDDIRSEEPRWVNNGTDSVHQKDGYTLIYNSTIGGVYMLYREANAAEIEWYNKLN